MDFEGLKKYSTVSLRVGLAIVLFWFAFAQFKNPSSWANLVPAYATTVTSAMNIVYMNASLEVVMASLILIGLYTRVVATVFTIHIIPIILALGLSSPSGIRDVGIFFATLSLAISGSDYLSMDSFMKKTRKKSK